MTDNQPTWMEMTGGLDPETYDRYRPTYPADLFSSIMEYASLSPDSRCLEIGVGTGQATEPFLNTGCDVVALEPSANLADFARAKYGQIPNFSLIQARFEEFETERPFDLIYAATSFHWVRSENRMRLLQSQLKAEGTVALFWNHPRPLDPVHADMQEVYQRYLPNDPGQNTTPWSEADAKKIADEMRTAGFRDVETLIFRQERHLTTEQYLGLLHTYSNHVNQPDELRVPLIKGLGAIIDSHGGLITVADTIDLHLGRL